MSWLKPGDLGANDPREPIYTFGPCPPGYTKGAVGSQSEGCYPNYSHATPLPYAPKTTFAPTYAPKTTFAPTPAPLHRPVTALPPLPPRALMERAPSPAPPVAQAVVGTILLGLGALYLWKRWA